MDAPDPTDPTIAAWLAEADAALTDPPALVPMWHRVNFDVDGEIHAVEVAAVSGADAIALAEQQHPEDAEASTDTSAVLALPTVEVPDE